jgi:hypothetical protein
MAKYVKPTLDTKFHIDFAWWQKHTQSLKTHLQSHACQRARELYEDQGPDEKFDWIHPETGEVFQLDTLWYLIHHHCSHDPDFLYAPTPLVTSIFRAFIANNNTPLTPIEIYERIQKKSPEMILRTIGGRRVFNGIRPAASSL